MVVIDYTQVNGYNTFCEDLHQMCETHFKEDQFCDTAYSICPFVSTFVEHICEASVDSQNPTEACQGMLQPLEDILQTYLPNIVSQTLSKNAMTRCVSVVENKTTQEACSFLQNDFGKMLSV